MKCWFADYHRTVLITMNAEWEKFLTECGAVIAGNRVRHFSEPDAECAAVVHESILTDLSHYGLLGAEGDDAATFLQNQLTNDIRSLDDGLSQLAGYCTPKGRLLGIFRLFGDGTRFYLRMPAEIVEPLHKRLQMFVLMSKVTLTPADEALQRIGIAGPRAGAALEKHLGTRPGGVDAVIRQDPFCVVQVPGEQRYEIYAPAKQLAALWQSLESELKPVGADAWPLLDILNGVPTVYEATVEHFIPQMVNLERIGGVSFKKGCFPGQEVVARMHYRGQSKRRMFRFACPGEAPAPGTPVMAAGGDKPREAGEVVDARRHPDGNCQGLAVLQTAGREQTLCLGDDHGAELQILDLPYRLEES